MELTLPNDILKKIIDYVSPSLNMCLVNKEFKSNRRPTTILSVDLIMSAEPWLIQEMAANNIPRDAVNALELSIWVCLQKGNTQKAQEYIDVASTMNDTDLNDRIRYYQSAFSSPFEHTITPIADIYARNVRNGNVAELLCAQHLGQILPTDFFMLNAALFHNNTLFATYMMLTSGYYINYSILELFISNNANSLGLLIWVVTHFLGKNDFDSSFLMSNLATNESTLEIFKYFHKVQGYEISQEVIEAAEQSNRHDIIEYITKLN